MAAASCGSSPRRLIVTKRKRLQSSITVSESPGRNMMTFRPHSIVAVLLFPALSSPKLRHRQRSRRRPLRQASGRYAVIRYERSGQERAQEDFRDVRKRPGERDVGHVSGGQQRRMHENGKKFAASSTQLRAKLGTEKRWWRRISSLPAEAELRFTRGFRSSQSQGPGGDCGHDQRTWQTPMVSRSDRCLASRRPLWRLQGHHQAEAALLRRLVRVPGRPGVFQQRLSDDRRPASPSTLFC